MADEPHVRQVVVDDDEAEHLREQRRPLPLKATGLVKGVPGVGVFVAEKPQG